MIVAVGASSFATADKKPLELLVQKGLTVRENPYKRKLTVEETIAHLQGASGLIAGLEPLNESVFKCCPNLKVIARVGIGIDNVDVKACEYYGIKVSNTPDAPTDAVVELTLTALLNIARNFSQANSDMWAGKWEKRIGFSLTGLKVLIIGAGRIGQKVRTLLSLLGCDVQTYDPFTPCDCASLAKGLAWAEVISLHASGNKEIIGAAEVQTMRDGVVILNSARGGLVNEDALYDALVCGKIYACWLDVFSQEPYSGRLTTCSNALLTPHISSYTRQCRLAMEMEAVENLLRDLGNHV